MSDYPTRKQLRKIRKWDILKQGVGGLIDLLNETWDHHYGRFILSSKNHLWISTGGWSGNESIMENLPPFFELIYWEDSHRGGHYHYIIKPWLKGNPDKQTQGVKRG